MSSNTKILIFITAILGLIFLLSVYLFFNQRPPTPKPEQDLTGQKQAVTEDTGPKKGELNYQEPQTKVEIGTQGVTKGNFEKVEAGNIFLREGDTLTQLPLTVDEIAVSCTTQDLASATELDFNLVTKVNVATPANITTFIPAQEPVVVFAQVVEGVNRVHTVALSAAKCTP